MQSNNYLFCNTDSLSFCGKLVNPYWRFSLYANVQKMYNNRTPPDGGPRQALHAGEAGTEKYYCGVILRNDI